MSFEEDTYNTIFKAMQHPIRRRILRMISEKPSTYTEIQRDLNIDNGLLNYHLDALSSLITKDTEEKYTLSDFGVATASLIKGVEEPNKAVKATSISPIMKAVTAVLVVILIISGVGLVELNNRYLELSGRYSALDIEIKYLQSALNASEASLSGLNATLAALEKNPLVKASTIIIDRVGVDYFNKYFHDPVVIFSNSSTNEACVVYKYRIDVNGYTTDRNVTFYSSPPNLLMQWGLPMEGNLQPFNVTMERARRLALEAGLPASPYELEATIVGYFEIDVLPPPKYANKYVWQVTSLIDPPWARTRTYTYAIIDPVTGEVYKTNGWGGTGLSLSQVDTAEKAAAQGIDGYVKLEYPNLPEQIQIVKGGNLTFTLRASFTSYNVNLQEVKLNVDPHYVDPYQIQSNMADKLRDVLSYEPAGVITLRAGETMSFTATLLAPVDAGQVFLFPRWALDGLGIGANGVLVLNQNSYSSEIDSNQALNPLRPYIDSAIPDPPYPSVRLAYITDVWKTIDGANITSVVGKAKSAGFNESLKEYIWEWKYDQGTIYRFARIEYEHTGMALYYDRESNLTHVQFFLSENENVTDSLWARLSLYMHVKQDVLSRTIWGFEQQYYNIDFVVAGMPDWERIKADMGDLTSQSYYLGTVSDNFVNGSILSATFSEIIQTDYVLSSPSGGSPNRCILRMEIDALGHTRLEIYESWLQRLTDPGSVFVSMFESLGLSASALQNFEFNESLWLSH